MNNSQATTKQMDADGEQQAFMAKNLPEFGKGLVSPNLHLTGSEAQAARTITDNDSSVCKFKLCNHNSWSDNLFT